MWTQVIWKYFTKNVQKRLIFQTLYSISPNCHMVCLQPNAWLESYDRYGSFCTMIWGSLIVSPVLWFLSVRNTLSVTRWDTACVCARAITNEWLLNNLHPAQSLLQPWNLSPPPHATLPQSWSWLTSAPPCPTPLPSMRENNPSTTILEFCWLFYCCCEDPVPVFLFQE